MKIERERLHSAYLLPSIVALLVFQPVFATLSSTPSETLMIPVVVTLAAVSWSLDPSGRWYRWGFALAGLALATSVARMVTPALALVVAQAAAAALLALLCVALGVRALFATSTITVRSLLTALSVYLLIGVGFALVYMVVFTVAPTWFKGVSPGGLSAEASELLYFSLGTLTTVAYGDILPAHPISRLLCNMEAVVGQMYIAVLVALLVGGYAAGRVSSTGGGSRGD